MKAREITIKQVDNGYEVSVGCKNLVFESRKKMLSELSDYLEDPKSVEKKYHKKYKWDKYPTLEITNGSMYFSTK